MANNQNSTIFVIVYVFVVRLNVRMFKLGTHIHIHYIESIYKKQPLLVIRKTTIHWVELLHTPRSHEGIDLQEQALNKSAKLLLRVAMIRSTPKIRTY